MKFRRLSMTAIALCTVALLAAACSSNSSSSTTTTMAPTSKNIVEVAAGDPQLSTP